MKKIKYCLLLSLVFALQACGDMNEIIEEYLDRGEISYVGRPDEISVLGGNHRARFTWKVGPDPRVQEGIIYWNGDLDSVVVAIDRSNLDELGFMTATVENLEEGSHEFSFRQIGKGGSPSIKVRQMVTIYGDLYQSSLIPRRIKTMKTTADGVKITWNNNPENGLRVLFHYTDSTGEKVVEIEPHTDEIVVGDISAGSEFWYETFFLPTNGLDEFAVRVDGNFPG